MNRSKKEEARRGKPFKTSTMSEEEWNKLIIYYEDTTQDERLKQSLAPELKSIEQRSIELKQEDMRINDVINVIIESAKKQREINNQKYSFYTLLDEKTYPDLNQYKKNDQVVVRTANSMTLELIDAIKEGDISSYRKKYLSSKFLIIYGVEELISKEATTREIREIIRQREGISTLVSIHTRADLIKLTKTDNRILHSLLL